MRHTDVIILGAGASGLCCGLLAARHGLDTAILDHGPVAARKLRLSGGGRCNFTHLDAAPEHYHSANPRFAASALARFTGWDAVSLFADMGLTYEEKEPGRLFCEQGAPALARALESAAADSGARIELNTTALGAKRTDQGFVVDTDKGGRTCRALVLALGGPSWPSAGATDAGFSLASSLGLKVLPPRPALAGLVLPESEVRKCRELAGVSLPARLSCSGPDGPATTVSGDLLFTHKGLGGPAAFDLSLWWTRSTEIVVDLLPSEDLTRTLRRVRDSRTSLAKHLSGLLPSRLPALFLKPSVSARPLCELSNTILDETAARIHNWTFTPARTTGMHKAEVTAGGVDTRTISSKTMEASDVPGLFVIGEVLDVTGRLGGYNLHWAWASAHAAAAHL